MTDVDDNLIEIEAKRLAQEDGIEWARLSEDYESPLNEFTSKSSYRKLAKQNLLNQT